MSIADVRLSLLALPQRWDGAGRLDYHLLVLPVGSPLEPLTGPGGPCFAGTQLKLTANFTSGLDDLPATAVIALSLPFAPSLPSAQFELFNALRMSYPITDTPQRRPIDPATQVRKSLPPSYLDAAGITAPTVAGAVLGDEFGCAILGQDPGSTRRGTPPPRSTTWGALIAASLRLPSLAEGLGLVYRLTLAVPPSAAAAGGWLYVTIDPDPAAPFSADAAADPSRVRSYAARIPPLPAQTRTLFAASLLPVAPAGGNPSAYDSAQAEAEAYDEGFALVVHTGQPVTADATTGGETGLVPATDAGLQIGWDDEQVVSWHNRQLDIARARAAGADPAAEVALGVHGYRVDVRRVEQGTPAPAWESLCTVSRDVSLASLRGRFDLEPPIEPVPARSARADDHSAWLPRYFAHWRGGSLAADDPVTHLLTNGGVQPPDTAATPVPPTVRLSYGARYQVRVRLADLSGGGPAASDTMITPRSSAISEVLFQRFVPPKALRVETDPPRPPMPPPAGSPPPAPAVGAVRTITVRRPLIGYPEMTFTRISQADLDQFIAGATARGGAPPPGQRIHGLPDPDVDAVQVQVQARTLAHDTGGDPPLDGAFRLVYTVTLPMPSLASSYAETPLTLRAAFTDVAQISDLIPPAASGGAVVDLPLPTARDVRIRLTPVCQTAPPGYFGTGTSHAGITVDIAARQEATGEDGLFEPLSLDAVLLARGPDSAIVLAQHLGADAAALELRTRPGTRTVMAASRYLRHSASGDGSAVTFASMSEIEDRWIIAVQVNLARDWTWAGLAAPGVQVHRDGEPVGVIIPPRAVSAAAVTGADQGSGRRATTLVFLDAVEVTPASGQFPRERTFSYSLTATVLGGPPVTASMPALRLPAASPPAQTPRLAAAGVALSPYQVTSDYSATLPRDRRLWLELEEPLDDPADALFARVLAYAPDPLLASAEEGTQPVEPPLPIPDERARVIVPGQSRDDAGADAMVALVPSATSPRHFMLPLPPGVTKDDALLFGLWTYELRVGHVRQWSTARGRFGRPLRVAGVQHPPPELPCVTGRVPAGPDAPAGVLAAAPYAWPIAADGTPLVDQGREGRPRTHIYFLLYGGARQADGSAFRNILLATHPGLTQGPEFRPGYPPPSAVTVFTEQEIDRALGLLGLAASPRLSVIAVEMWPNGNPDVNPLTAGLGTQRILRISTLTPVAGMCPPDAAPLPRMPEKPALPVMPPPLPAPVPGGGGSR
jgi:hypothetical protein